MKKMILYFLLTLSWAVSAQNTFDPAVHSTFQTARADGRFVSSRAVAHRLMNNDLPAFAFPQGLPKEDFPAWKAHVGEVMGRLMKHPVIQNLPVPVCVSVQQRAGYRVEKWEAYPLPECVVPYLVLIPDQATEQTPTPAILCIPGWGGTKEELAGEPEWKTTKEIKTKEANNLGEAHNTEEANDSEETFNRHRPTRNAMAWKYVQEGWIAVAIDNPGSGEAADLEQEAGAGGYDFQNFARALLEMDWSYLGYSSYVSQHILNWMKGQPVMRQDRILVSGFSFGTEPLMVLGALDPSIYAFVYNDFVCRTRERALVMTKPDANGRRPWPNDISHLIPGFLRCFDFPDLVANLAPRPVICTEGGLDRDFQLIKKAYDLSGAPDHFTFYHYKAFEEPDKRKDLSHLPEGLDRDTYFRLVNVDPKNHYFKAEYVIPWMKALLGTD